MFAVLLEEASEPNRNRIAIETRRNPLGRGLAALARRSELRTGKIVANRKGRGKGLDKFRYLDEKACLTSLRRPFVRRPETVKYPRAR